MTSAETTLTIQRNGNAYDLTIGASSMHYHGLEHSSDLGQFSMIDMALGIPAPVFHYSPAQGETRGFFRAQLNDVYSPGDADKDGMDDLWELQNNLAPLNPTDALLPNLHDPGRSNLAYYRGIFGLEPITSFYSVETSVLNRPFAISEEASVFNFPALATMEAISDEISLYNFPPPAGVSMEALAEEVSVFNASVASLPVHTFSTEVSVFNSFSTQQANHAISPEVSVFNDNATQPDTHVISSEVSILNTMP